MSKKVVSSVGMFPSDVGSTPFLVFLKFSRNGRELQSCPSSCFHPTPTQLTRVINLVKSLSRQGKGQVIPCTWGWLYSVDPYEKQVFDG
jgi:hypothetical protein